MKKWIIPAAALSTVLLLSIYCAENDYSFDNPFDKKGTNYLFGDTTNEKEKIGDANGNTVGDLLDPKDTVRFNANFNVNEGSGTPPRDRTVATGASITLPSSGNLTKSNHAFGGWNTRSDGNGANYTGEYKVDGSTTLYAKWISTSVPQTNRYMVTFDANANDADGTPPSAQMVDTGSTINLPNQGGLSREGYDFGGWNTERDGTGDTYSAGSPYKPTGDVTLYAKWNNKSGPTTFTIAFSANGATSGTAPTDMTADSGTTITLPGSNGLSRNNDTFGGWNTNSSGTGTNYSASSSYTVNSNATLYAKWDAAVQPVTYTLTIAASAGGTVSPSVGAHTYDAGTLVTVTATAHSGYTFKNWSGESSSTSATINITMNGNKTLTANFQATTQYTVSFNANGGSGTAPSAQTVDAGYVIMLPNGDGLTKSGYTFGGWNANNSGTGTNYGAGSSYTVNGNVTLFAMWEWGGKGNDIKNYKTVTIGTQTWMAENLDYYVEGSKCYGNSPDSCAKYGRLYNWATAMNGASGSRLSPSGVQGACPVGWHVPSDAEWTTLENAVGGRSTAGTKLKSTSGWYNNGNGTDQYGFAALPGGYGYGYSGGDFSSAGSFGFWWSATAIYPTDADYRHMYYDDVVSVTWVNSDKTNLFSVRCVQD